MLRITAIPNEDETGNKLTEEEALTVRDYCMEFKVKTRELIQCANTFTLVKNAAKSVFTAVLTAGIFAGVTHIPKMNLDKVTPENEVNHFVARPTANAIGSTAGRNLIDPTPPELRSAIGKTMVDPNAPALQHFPLLSQDEPASFAEIRNEIDGPSNDVKTKDVVGPVSTQKRITFPVDSEIKASLSKSQQHQESQRHLKTDVMTHQSRNDDNQLTPLTADSHSNVKKSGRSEDDLGTTSIDDEANQEPLMAKSHSIEGLDLQESQQQTELCLCLALE